MPKKKSRKISKIQKSVKKSLTGVSIKKKKSFSLKFPSKLKLWPTKSSLQKFFKGRGKKKKKTAFNNFTKEIGKQYKVVKKRLEKGSAKLPFKKLFENIKKRIKARVKKKKQRKILRLLLLIVLFPILNKIGRLISFLFIIFCIFGINIILRDLPSPDKITTPENYPVSTLLYDRNGKLLYEIFADQNRIPINLEDLPKHVTQATLSIEDKNFYKHFGFDIRGIVRAIRTNMKGERIEGGSTITQQLVKNALLTKEKTISRKVKEGVLAIFTEIKYSKDEILEMYLNYISYGGTAVGIESAANRYFDKSAKDLSLAEAALLAGLPQAPSRYSPFGSSANDAKIRQKQVLNRMVEDGYITQDRANKAYEEHLNYALKKTDIEAPHFVFFVRDLLYEKYGHDKVDTGGLRVTTTLDLDIHNKIQEIVTEEIKRVKKYRIGNSGVVVTKPNTGEILSMVGSYDYFNTEDDGQVNVTLAKRQPGSSIKPLLYATAFQQKKLNPGTLLLDMPTCFEVINQKPYCPRNYSGSFRGAITVRQALGNSLNIPAVKAIRTISIQTFVKQVTKMGITTFDDPIRFGLAMSLGGNEVRMIDMAQAFGVLANQGVKSPLTPIIKITDYNGNVIEDPKLEERKDDLEYLTYYDAESERNDLERVMDRAPAYMISHILQDDRARQATFGANSKLVIKDHIVSAKTGTTNDLKDNWAIGFTPEFATVVWVGNNDNSKMGWVASGRTGATPIFHDVMTFILEKEESIMQDKPDDVKKANVCHNGMPPKYANNECSTHANDLYWIDSEPSRSKNFTKDYWIKPETGLPPKQGEEADNLVLEHHSFFQDPVTDLFCNDCARPIDEEGKIIYESNFVTEDYVIKNWFDEDVF